MTVALRFALRGPRHGRIFHLVAANKAKGRDALPIETLGIFDPQLKNGETTKTVQWSTDRIKYWLRQGAEPSPSVVRLLTMGGLLTEQSRYHKKLGLPSTPAKNTKSV